MLRFPSFSIQQNFKNILSLIESNEKNCLFEILSQDNIIQSINLQNTVISQFLFNHIADLFDVAIDIKFSSDLENQFQKKIMVNQENYDQEIKSDDSKIECSENNFYKISSNARESLVALASNFPAQFSENSTFHSKMNQILGIINSQGYTSDSEIKEDTEQNSKTDTSNEKANSFTDVQDDQIDKSNVEVNTKISAVLLSRIIFALGKSENYSILASLSDDQDFFPKFCSLLGTHCAIYDALFTLSNDDMPAVSLFFEDMDTTEILLEMIQKSIPIIQKLSNNQQKNDSSLTKEKLVFHNNGNVLINYYNIEDIFRMQKRALTIIIHLISNAEKDSVLIKNLSEKYEYMNFIFEDLGLKSLSKEVAANAFSLLIRLYQISSNPIVVNKSSLFNPFMNSKQVDSDYEDYDLDYDSDYDSSENLIKKSKMKKNKDSSKKAKKIPPIKSFLESKIDALCQYIIDSETFNISIEKALDIVCLLLHSPEIQNLYFNKNESNILQKMIEKLVDNFFKFPNCSILHTNFRKIFSLIIKIDEQKSFESEKAPFVIKVCNYLKEKIIQILVDNHNEQKDEKTIEQKDEKTIEQKDEKTIEQKDEENIEQKDEKTIEQKDEKTIEQKDEKTIEQEDEKTIEQKDEKTIEQEDEKTIEQKDEENIEQKDEKTIEQKDEKTIEQKDEKTIEQKDEENIEQKDEKIVEQREIKIVEQKDMNLQNSSTSNSSNCDEKTKSTDKIESNKNRYDFTKYCFWGIVVELVELIEKTINRNSTVDNNMYWSQFIKNDVRRFKDITSYEYGGPIPQSTRTYGKILCVRSPSSNSEEPKQKNISLNNAKEKLDFGEDSDDD